MKATKKCQFCGKPFVTRSGMQRYCSEACQAEAKRARTVQKNNLFKAARPLMEIQHQEYLTFSKAATLMGCSRQYVYKLVALGKLKASRISSRMAFIRRADIERMLEGNPYHRVLPGSTSAPGKSASSSLPAKKEKREKETDEVSDFYSGEEVMSLYKVKQSWLYTTAKRNRIPICRIAGKNYYSKKHVDEFFGVAVDTSNITDWLLIEEAEELFKDVLVVGNAKYKGNALYSLGVMFYNAGAKILADANPIATSDPDKYAAEKKKADAQMAKAKGYLEQAIALNAADANSKKILDAINAAK